MTASAITRPVPFSVTRLADTSVLAEEVPSTSSAIIPRVLVVENEEKVAHVVANALTREGYEATETKTGLDAMTLISGGATFDLMILDVTLPDLDGREVFRHMCVRGHSVPAIFLVTVQVP
jgi:CheY-like chemotaxis protein